MDDNTLLAEIRAEQARQREMLEKLLRAVPGAVDSEQSAQERRARQEELLRLAANSG